MSLCVVVWTPTGLVMAADSRTSITYNREDKHGRQSSSMDILTDNTYKLVLLDKCRVGISTYGVSHPGGLPVDAHLHILEQERLTADDCAPTVAEKVQAYFQDKFPKMNLWFFVVGYREENGASIPYVYNISVEKNTITRVNIQPNGERWPGGVSRGGATDIVNRLILADRLPEFSLLPLQDAVDYAIFLVEVTIKAMRFEPGVDTVGGPVDVLVITPKEASFLQRKELHGSAR